MLTKLRFALFVILSLVLTLTASAQRESEAPDAYTMAKYVPNGAMFYATTRTDAAFIETLDGLLNRLSEEMGGTPSPDLLGSFINGMGVRSWLGDSIALYILPPTSISADSSELYGFLIEITDQAAAIEYYTELYNQEPTQLTDRLVAFLTSGTNVFITDKLVIIGETGISAYIPGTLITSDEDGATAVPLAGNPSLADSPRFGRAINALPAAENYPAFVYFDPRSVITASSPAVFSQIQPVDVPALAEALGVFSLGLTQLDGQTYTLDIGWSKGEGSIFTALYLPDPQLPVPAPLNLDFLNVVPADAHFVFQGTSLWSQLEANTRGAGTLVNAVRNRLLTAGLMDIALTNPMIWFNSEWAAAFTELSLRGSLDLESEQLRAALDGDYVMAARLTAQPDERVPRLVLEPGIWLASRDNGSRDLLEGGANLIETFGVELGRQASSFTFPVIEPLSVTGQGNVGGLPPELIWLATDTLTYIGADALTLENKETLVAVPRLLERIEPIRPYLLDGATHFAWIDFTALKPITDQADANIQMTFKPFDSLFASLRQTETGFTARLAFRLK